MAMGLTATTRLRPGPAAQTLIRSSRQRLAGQPYHKEAGRHRTLGGGRLGQGGREEHLRCQTEIERTNAADVSIAIQRLSGCFGGVPTPVIFLKFASNSS